MKKINTAYVLFALLAVFYIALIFILPPDTNTLSRYNISTTQARQLSITVAVPYTIIWFIAFFGSAQIRRYSKLIKSTGEGRALFQISDGLLILSVGLPIAAILGNLLTYVGRTHDNLMGLSVILSNYLDIAIGLAAMTLLYKGACSLAKTVDSSVDKRPQMLINISLAIIGTSFAGFALSNPARQFPTSEVGRAAYYLPDALIGLTIILPLLYIWYKGLQAAYCIEVYRRHVRGRIYKSALGYLASGIVFIVLSRIALRYLVSLNTIVQTWALQYLLIVIYALLILIAIGFVLVAKGSYKLRRLEEV